MAVKRNLSPVLKASAVKVMEQVEESAILSCRGQIRAPTGYLAVYLELGYSLGELPFLSLEDKT